MTLTAESARQALNGVMDPNIGKGLADSGEIASIQVDGESVAAEISLDYPAKDDIEPIRSVAAEALKAAGAATAFVTVKQGIRSHKVQPLLRVLPNVKNIIAVSSGKGGVGKSTVAANLALALSALGARVGVLDADVYGPSQPTMLGAKGVPQGAENTLYPMESHGLQINSIGFWVDPGEPLIWRGPMIASALKQMLTDTQWDNLDYLVIDMPPGTGDIQLTLSQEIPVAGAIVVTTPQDIATLDAKRGLVMFRKVNVPVLGIVENMALFRCPHCGHLEHIFGEGGAERMSKEYGVPVLGSLPLDTRIREEADSGLPTVIAEPESDTAKIFLSIAKKAAAALSQLPRDFSAGLPKVKPAEAKE
ncbi:MAG: iron-sulfur cluster carrier protein ApbC [Sutterellaceae bacterium]|nr:iron-sulfur cluster carrier protein ApbC [Sutterellaceae bacterium]MDD7441070.1 iron-sulfur cluster carrier protein ApbC [Sutterellaceae bacterium]